MHAENIISKVWENYLNSIGETSGSTEKIFSYWHFDNNEDSANALADLVLEGRKKATASSLWVFEHDNEPIPKSGDYSIILNWSGVPKAIIKTTKVTIVQFNEVKQEFAEKEGEGDLSLEYWRKVHIDFFSRECARIGKQFTETMPVVCEEFELVYRVDEMIRGSI